MPLTRSQGKLPDKIIHDYPLERKSSKPAVKVPASPEKHSKSTETSGLEDINNPDFNKALIGDEQTNPTCSSNNSDSEKVIEIQAEINPINNSENSDGDLSSGNLSENNSSSIELPNEQIQNEKDNVKEKSELSLESENQIEVLEKGEIKPISEISEESSESFDSSSNLFTSARGYFTPKVQFNLGIGASSTQNCDSSNSSLWENFEFTNLKQSLTPSHSNSKKIKIIEVSSVYKNQFFTQGSHSKNSIEKFQFPNQSIGTVTSSNKFTIGNESDKISEVEENSELEKGTENSKSGQSKSSLHKLATTKFRKEKNTLHSKDNPFIKTMHQETLPKRNLTKQLSQINPDDNKNKGNEENESVHETPRRLTNSSPKIDDSCSSTNGRWRKDANREIPEFDGNKHELSKYIKRVQAALRSAGEANEQEVLDVATLKLKGKLYERVEKYEFTKVGEFLDWLKKRYNPPRDIYQLEGELGSTVQLDNETIDQYSFKIQDLKGKIEEAQKCIKGILTEEDINRIEKMTINSFKQGLKTEIYDKMKSGYETFKDALRDAVKIENDIYKHRSHRNLGIQTALAQESEKGKKKISMKFVESTGEAEMAPFENGKVESENYQKNQSYENFANNSPKQHKNNSGNIDICNYCNKRD